MKRWFTLIFIIIPLQFSNASSSAVNDEVLLKSLINSGVICSELSYSEQQKALQIYLNKRAVHTQHKNSATPKPPPSSQALSKQTPSPSHTTEGTECIKPE